MLTIHVMPVHDLIEHEDTDECVCQPRITLFTSDDGADNWLVTHHSLDGRELREPHP